MLPTVTGLPVLQAMLVTLTTSPNSAAKKSRAHLSE